MDRELSKQQEIERLVRLASSARSSLENEAITLKQRLDVPSRIKTSLRTNPAGWLFGSAASGLAASLFLRRKPARPEKPARGMALSLGGLILTVLQPIAKIWLTNALKNYLTASSSSFQNTPAGIKPSPTSSQ